MESFKERNQKIKNENHRKIAKKNSDQEIRHENNLIKINEENEKLSKVNEEKEFKKYCAFYWQRKTKEKENSKKIKNRSSQKKIKGHL